MTKTILLSMALLSAPVSAAPVLWQNIEVGMTMEQVRALYPEQKGVVRWKSNRVVLEGLVTVGTCKPEAVVVFTKAGVVKEVVVEGGQETALHRNCYDVVFDGMVGRYGNPQGERANEGDFMDTVESDELTSRWVRDGVIVELERVTGPWRSWTVTYRPTGAAVATGL